MAFDYHVIGLVPTTPAFDLRDADDALATIGYSLSHLTSAEGRTGARVVAPDGWGITIWLDDDDDAREANARLAEASPPQGMTAAEVVSCPAQLSIWSDDDESFMNAHVFEELIQFLHKRFGILLWDNRLGEWR